MFGFHLLAGIFCAMIDISLCSKELRDNILELVNFENGIKGLCDDPEDVPSGDAIGRILCTIIENFEKCVTTKRDAGRVDDEIEIRTKLSEAYDVFLRALHDSKLEYVKLEIEDPELMGETLYVICEFEDEYGYRKSMNSAINKALKDGGDISLIPV